MYFTVKEFRTDLVFFIGLLPAIAPLPVVRKPGQTGWGKIGTVEYVVRYVKII